MDNNGVPVLPPLSTVQQSPTAATEHRVNTTMGSRSQRKLKLIGHLVSSLDMIVFVELCALYYMDCSLFRLLIRVTAQWMLNPTPIENLVHMPANSAYLLVIAIPNIICMLLHLSSPPLEPAPASRGYMHGGVIVDFIGQKPPGSCIPLLLIDIFVVVLQCTVMSIQMEREGINQVTALSADLSTQPPQPSDPVHSVPPRSEINDRLLEEGGLQLPEGPPPDQDSSQLEDSLRSGTALLADLDLSGCLRRAYSVAPNERMLSGTYSLQNLRYSRTLGALAAERRRQVQQNVQQSLPQGG